MPAVSWKRWCRWTLFLGMLVGLGVGIYQAQAPEPRWTADARRVVRWPHWLYATNPLRFSPDGKWVYTAPVLQGMHGAKIMDRSDNGDVLQLWDAASGKAMAWHPTAGRLVGEGVFSADLHYWAAECEMRFGEKRFLCLVDLHTGEEHTLPLPAADLPSDLRFSPCGKYLAVVRKNEPTSPDVVTLRIYTSATGELRAERNSIGLLGTAFANDCLLHYCPSNTIERVATGFAAAAAKAPEKRLELWGLPEGKVVGVLNDLGEDCVVSADGRYLLSKKPDPHWKTAATCQVWNLQTVALQSSFQSEINYGNITMAPNGLWVAFRGTRNTHDSIELWDLAAGKQLGSAPADHAGRTLIFSPDSRFLAAVDLAPVLPIILSRAPRIRGMQMFETPTLEPLWHDARARSCHFLFARDGQTVIATPGERDVVHILDSATGKPCHEIPVTDLDGINSDFTATPDGRFLLIRQRELDFWGRGAFQPEPFWRRALVWLHVDPARFDPKHRDVLVVYDLEAGCERLRLQGWGVDVAVLADDGRTLVTTHDDDGDGRVVRCWDVGAWKPLRWALGVPAGLGVLLLAVAKGLARWRHRPGQAQAK